MLGAPAVLRIPWRTTAHAAARTAGRSKSCSLIRWALAATVALAGLPAPASAAAAMTQSPARLARTAAGAVIELASGERLALALPAGATLDSVAATTTGWVAAGTTPAAPAAPAAPTDIGGGSDLLLLSGPFPAAAAGGGAQAAGAGARTAAPAATMAVAPRRLAAPNGRSGAVRAEPLVLVEDGVLTGLVWLEGDRAQAFRVCYAAWNGAAWAPTQTVSPAGPGSQLALTAARLADGSWLLAWSGFDGQDDEIVWSLGRKGVWSRPVALTDNQVPDITPSLAAAGSGALIAWSQLASGGYRLLVARFADGAWSAPVEAATGGALYPTFEAAPDADHLRLLYRDAARRTWAALDLDAAGRPLRRAALPSPAAGTVFNRPALRLPAPPPERPGTPDTSNTPDTSGALFHWSGLGAQQPDQIATWTPLPRTAAAHALAEVGATAEAGAASGTGEAGEADAARGTGAARAEGAGVARVDGAGAPALPKAGAPVYIAFGDSITAGFGDSANEGGYPGRLQGLLTMAAGGPVTVVNAGLFGETTGEGLSRIGSVLQPGATGLLLMEGTNDISARVSQSTIVQNLDAMASQAEALGITAYHATIIPRLPTADFDSNNDISAALAGAIRELAWERSRGLIDPFEVFFVLTPGYQQLYLGGDDKLHPNAAGYTLLAQTFANVLEDVDLVPPVPGLVSPPQGQQNVPADSAIEVDLFDFGAGIDLANTQLLINDQVVATTPTGDKHKLEFRYQPPAPLVGVVKLGVQTQDLASPPNTFSGTLSQFIITGTVFLTGDLNQDGIVDGLDLLLFAPCFGAHRYNTNFQVLCDLNGDGVIDGLDLAILAANFGKRSF